MKILIKNARVITLDKSNMLLEDSNIEIDGKYIKSINKDKLNEDAFDRVIDAKYKIVMPGYINAHTHFYSSFAKGIGGIAASDNFVEVLENMWWRLDKKLLLEDSHYSALTAIMDGIKKGVTTFIDHHASPYAVTNSLPEIAKAVERMGVKASLCYEISDRDGQDIKDAGILENFSFIQENNNPDITGLIGLHASFTLSDDTLKEIVSKNTRAYGYHIHVSEDKADEVDAQAKYGMSVVERLAKFGIVNEKSILAHCVNISDTDRAIIKENQGMIVHNPESNLNNAVGISNVLKQINDGILVGLGTDAMTNNMGNEMRIALWLQHIKQNNPSCGFMEVASTLLENNAAIANRLWDTDKFGLIKEGNFADLIILDYDPITPLHKDNVYGHIVFGIAEANVSTTISNGKILWHNNQFEDFIDQHQINKHSRELAKKLWERL
jgi:putative selenium metabolism protein SsnA